MIAGVTVNISRYPHRGQRMRTAGCPIRVGLFIVALSIACSSRDSSKQRTGSSTPDFLARRQAIEAAIETLVKRTNADMNWERAIRHSSSTTTPVIYTADLEALWVVDRPILFSGNLQDAATEDERDYRIRVNGMSISSPQLHLELLCPRDMVLPILSRIKTQGGDTLPGGIAVAARITRVAHDAIHEADGSRTVFTGYGRCEDIIYVGDSLDILLMDPFFSKQ